MGDIFSRAMDRQETVWKEAGLKRLHINWTTSRSGKWLQPWGDYTSEGARVVLPDFWIYLDYKWPYFITDIPVSGTLGEAVEKVKKYFLHFDKLHGALIIDVDEDRGGLPVNPTTDLPTLPGGYEAVSAALQEDLHPYLGEMLERSSQGIYEAFYHGGHCWVAPWH
jgi:hypothetical protein